MKTENKYFLPTNFFYHGTVLDNTLKCRLPCYSKEEYRGRAIVNVPRIAQRAFLQLFNWTELESSLSGVLNYPETERSVRGSKSLSNATNQLDEVLTFTRHSVLCLVLR